MPTSEVLIGLLFGLLLSSAIGWLAYRRGSLTRSGVFGAILTGTMTFGFGGLLWGVALIVFFVSSSALGHIGEARKATLKATYEKGDQRDLGQALANGGLAALIALLYAFSHAEILWAAYIGTLATVNADTWATELGALANAAPRLITTGRSVPRGTSGGVTLVGFAVSLGGGLLIGAVGALNGQPILLLIGALSGLAGSVFDSLLGATVQAMYQCGDRVVEKPICPDGTAALPLAGRLPWLRNDGVNFAASVVGALVGAALYRLTT